MTPSLIWLKTMVKIIILFGSFIFQSFEVLAENVIIDSPKPLPNATHTPTTEEDSVRKKNSPVALETRPEFLISPIYRNGEHLIYDCKKRHFACVNKESFEYCQRKRKEAFVLRYKYLPCVPLKKFKTQTKCYQKQIDIIGQIPNKKFCLNWDKKLLN